MTKTVKNIQINEYKLTPSEVMKVMISWIEDEHMVVVGDNTSIRFNNDGSAQIHTEYNIRSSKDE